MPLQNRVTPLGELVVAPARGLVYGNRGCLHDDERRVRRAWATRRWIACRLEFKGRKRGPLLRPGRYTELFFLDEATALAAGHRPCAECRRADYDRLVALWRGLHPEQEGADAIDEQLHAERLEPRTRERRIHRARFGDLPDGAVVILEGSPHVVVHDRLLRWTPGGYGGRIARPRGEAQLVTPPSLVALLNTSEERLVPLLHPSARRVGRSPLRTPLGICASRIRESGSEAARLPLRPRSGRL